MADATNPLTHEDLASINAALDNIKTAEAQIALAKRADIDVSAQEAELQKNKTQLLKIKQVYFPGQ